MTREPRRLAARETTVILDAGVFADPAPIAALLAPRPDVAVQVNLDEDVTNLDGLAQLPPSPPHRPVRRGSAGRDGSCPPCRQPRLLRLEFGGHSVPLAQLGRLTRLRQLYLRKPGRPRDLGPALAAMHRLEDLTLHNVTLHNVTLADTGYLSGLTRLRGLTLKLGGTRDLSVLRGLPALEFVELWQVHALDSIDDLGHCHRLTALFLQALSRVRRLPDLSATRLADLHLERLSGLTDLTPLRSAPLRNLKLMYMGHLRLAHLQPLVGHPTLRTFASGLGSITRDEAAWRLLSLPRPDHHVLDHHAAGVMGLPPLAATPETAD